MDVTIVIPTYKRADRIVRAVNSALEQTVKDKEVIVVDDNGKNSKAQLETEQALKDFNLKPALLGIEVTESGYLENTYHYKKLWSSLKEEGITLVLDDYGTGYSNAYRLSNLTPHYIKIDRVLTQKALSSNYERSILIYIIEMAHSLKLNVCIEGVETEEELQEIKKLNPDYIQGYLFGKPAPEDEFYNRQIKKK